MVPNPQGRGPKMIEGYLDVMHNRNISLSA